MLEKNIQQKKKELKRSRELHVQEMSAEACSGTVSGADASCSAVCVSICTFVPVKQVIWSTCPRGPEEYCQKGLAARADDLFKHSDMNCAFSEFAPAMLATRTWKPVSSSNCFFFGGRG